MHATRVQLLSTVRQSFQLFIEFLFRLEKEEVLWVHNMQLFESKVACMSGEPSRQLRICDKVAASCQII